MIDLLRSYWFKSSSSLVRTNQRKTAQIEPSPVQAVGGIVFRAMTRPLIRIAQVDTNTTEGANTSSNFKSYPESVLDRC